MRILVLEIDGLQPAYMGPYGCEWLPTPTFDRWAAEGVVFDQYFVDCPDPSVRPGWRTVRNPLAPSPTTTDLIADLRSAGVRSARVGPPQSGDGWDVDTAVDRDDADPTALKSTIRGIRRAIEKLGDHPNSLLWVIIDCLLPPWLPTEDALSEVFTEPELDDDSDDGIRPWTGELPERIDSHDDLAFDRLQKTYGATVGSLNASLDRLLRECDKRGWGDESIRVLTASRGFPLGEHGPVGFDVADLHEELVHLPLILRLPESQHAGLRITALSQPVDFGATLRELFGLPPASANDDWAGRSLMPLIRGDCTAIRDRAVTGWPCPGRTLWGVRTLEHYLMLDGARRLFLKPDDRCEVNDVQPRNHELAEEMEREFRTGLEC